MIDQLLHEMRPARWWQRRYWRPRTIAECIASPRVTTEELIERMVAEYEQLGRARG